jgi:hypothetical protein
MWRPTRTEVAAPMPSVTQKVKLASVMATVCAAAEVAPMRPARTPTIAKTPTSATTCKPLGMPSRKIVRTRSRWKRRRSGSGGASMLFTAPASVSTIAVAASVEAMPEPATPSAGRPMAGRCKRTSVASP